MRLVGGTVYALQVPFVESFRHSAGARVWSDSVVVRVEDEAGTEGFGEGVPRPYVTGETVEVGLTAEGRGLALGRALASFPVALLETAP